MTFKTYEIHVDLVSDASTTHTIRFSQNDRNSAKLLLTITNKGAELDLSQAKAVRISFEKSDGTRVFQNDCQPINVLKGRYQILLKTQTLSSVGNVIAQIHIEEEDRMIDTQKFLFVVNESLASDGAVESANEFTIIQKAIEAGKKLEGVDLTTITDFLPNQRDFIALLRNHN
ncbi:BppU family phage baseplate upper protein, partial [Bacillus cereus]|uniref:BppU family phage baseplate upper protein n=1 Tax=Bacillus cereus TaxID=1396 RepID=UPI0018F5B683